MDLYNAYNLASKALRYGTCYTQFYLPPNTSHTCLYSPAADHHRPLADTHCVYSRMDGQAELTLSTWRQLFHTVNFWREDNWRTRTTEERNRLGRLDKKIPEELGRTAEVRPEQLPDCKVSMHWHRLPSHRCPLRDWTHSRRRRCQQVGPRHCWRSRSQRRWNYRPTCQQHDLYYNTLEYCDYICTWTNAGINGWMDSWVNEWIAQRYTPYSEKSGTLFSTITLAVIAWFLQRGRIACNAERCNSYGNSWRLSHAGTLSRRMNIGSRGLHCAVTKTL